MYDVFDNFVNIIVWYKSIYKFESSEWKVTKVPQHLSSNPNLVTSKFRNLSFSRIDFIDIQTPSELDDLHTCVT